MQKVAAFKTTNGKIFENIDDASREEVESDLVEFFTTFPIQQLPDNFDSLLMAKFIAEHRVQLRAILEPAINLA